jgi:hypothetical protein
VQVYKACISQGQCVISGTFTAGSEGGSQHVQAQQAACICDAQLSPCLQVHVVELALEKKEAAIRFAAAAARIAAGLEIIAPTAENELLVEPSFAVAQQPKQDFAAAAADFDKVSSALHQVNMADVDQTFSWGISVTGDLIMVRGCDLKNIGGWFQSPL